jgi:LDH2 family malate/lactate/ureidoglycolate dehydrogenase
MKFDASALVSFSQTLLERAGLPVDKARDVAEILVEGDLLGHTTHGLQLLPGYLEQIQSGRMTAEGDPAVLADLPAAIAWDGRRLPGPWLLRRALALAVDRARVHGTCTVSIRRSHHLACLAAFLPPVAAQGYVVLLACSDPGIATVAPHGGRTPCYSPDPIAAAWPTAGEPVVLDVSMSILSNGMTNRLHRAGKKLPGAFAIDAAGNLTDDPAQVVGQPPGALLPIGGDDHGHKGYALGLLVEALTGGLAGHGRADTPEGWSANVFLQVLDPALFGGRDDFVRQADHLARACRASSPRPGYEAVRLPGEAGLARRARQLAEGLELAPGILEGLLPWAEKLKTPPPAALVR